MNITLLGIGSGDTSTLTQGAAEALAGAGCIIGARRLLAGLPDSCTPNRVVATKPDAIRQALEENADLPCVVAYSGDSGFYSGCRSLLPLLQGQAVTVLPGISSVQMLAAALGRPWQDWNLVSAHGVTCNAVAAVMQGKPAFFLTGGTLGPAELCRQLTDAGLGTLPVTVGEDLGCEAQNITVTTAQEAAERSFSALSVLLAEAAPQGPRRTPGWPDNWFVRGAVPMTKQMVRAAALAALAPKAEDTLWDVGAGTGSVSVELAAVASRGRVYAVECEAEACRLIEENRRKFCAWNLHPVPGRAPEALSDLLAPDGVFIGGTKGGMVAVVDTVLARNPAARLCITAIALETVTTAMQALQKHGVDPCVRQLAVSATRTAGRVHMLTAQNPIFLITGNCDD
ncbi:precorrin-6y C5,15-methyltransferase (decarboxylating) subunit CbiE [Gemmiger formicilis]|uniref:precorrin-6y C5,15-methyltransferase (decarboxylating) subunit CbiE n=1 Tax=Gemmiger formicilis TaxID=745368 RepID=UPI00195BDD3A|nr:precorrin-6y C5,15-methyltransferase (decarboxylating) subunit CbiE [Gemmiger formicilis]MBM6715511.1 precorrin-6y C5,15-methyltransferase (decarboxylating) subunit CbiE [Gemmiger formicilis]